MNADALELDAILRRFQDHLHAMLSGGAIGPETFQQLMGELLRARVLTARLSRRTETDMPMFVRTQEQMDDIVKATILSYVDQLDAALEDKKVHHREVDGVLRAIEIGKEMVANIRKTQGTTTDIKNRHQ